MALESERKIDHMQLKALIAGIAAFVAKAKIVYPAKKLSVCRDKEDNMLFECCSEAGANVLLASDKDILDLKDLPFDLKILTPRKFIEEF